MTKLKFRIMTTSFLAMSLALVLAPRNASAQAVTYTVAPMTSVAWWQVDPNYGHLWATTCPDDPSWQAGESRQGSAPVHESTRKKVSVVSYSDKSIPLYQRLDVNPVRRPAVSGSIVVGDTVHWSQVHGEIKVLGDSLYTGLNMRDAYARHAVLETPHNRYIVFTVDSLTDVQQANDTIHATAVGTFLLHGVTQPMTAPVKAWHDAAGLRVQTQFHFPADNLVKVYNMSKIALGMGVMMGRWKEMHMGVDVIMKPN